MGLVPISQVYISRLIKHLFPTHPPLSQYEFLVTIPLTEPDALFFLKTESAYQRKVCRQEKEERNRKRRLEETKSRRGETEKEEEKGTTRLGE